MDDETTVDLVSVTPNVIRHFESVSLKIMDPMDALIMSTALALDVPLVTADNVITRSNLVDVIW